jgi:hypothetical protein
MYSYSTLDLSKSDTVSYNWFTPVCSEGKPVTGLGTEKAVSFYDEMKITEKCTFSEGFTLRT